MAFLSFKTRSPRKFNHKYLYVNERKERLKRLEEQAKRDLGMITEDEFNSEALRGTFVKATTHLRRRKEKGHKPLKIGTIILIIGALLLLWYYLVTGNLFLHNHNE